MTSQVDSGCTRNERLDRLRFTREHGRLVLGSGLGWALDAIRDAHVLVLTLVVLLVLGLILERLCSYWVTLV